MKLPSEHTTPEVKHCQFGGDSTDLMYGLIERCSEDGTMRYNCLRKVIWEFMPSSGPLVSYYEEMESMLLKDNIVKMFIEFSMNGKLMGQVVSVLNRQSHFFIDLMDAASLEGVRSLLGRSVPSMMDLRPPEGQGGIPMLDYELIPGENDRGKLKLSFEQIGNNTTPLSVVVEGLDLLLFLLRYSRSREVYVSNCGLIF